MNHKPIELTPNTVAHTINIQKNIQLPLRGVAIQQSRHYGIAIPGFVGNDSCLRDLTDYLVRSFVFLETK
jgi:hypothetical protein